MTELKTQLHAVREEMSEREQRHQTELERLGTAREQQESDTAKSTGNDSLLSNSCHIWDGFAVYYTYVCKGD